MSFGLSDVIALLALSVALLALCIERKKWANELLYQSASSLLEAAYKSLTKGMQKNNFPISDRLQWLTTARYLIRYREAKSKIKSKDYLQLCNNVEVFYRDKFQEALDCTQVKRGSYFRHSDDEGIEPTSAIVVIEFSEWKKGENDPIDNYDHSSFFRDTNSIGKNPGLISYLCGFDIYKKEIDKVKS